MLCICKSLAGTLNDCKLLLSVHTHTYFVRQTWQQYFSWFTLSGIRATLPTRIHLVTAYKVPKTFKKPKEPKCYNVGGTWIRMLRFFPYPRLSPFKNTQNHFKRASKRVKREPARPDICIRRTKYYFICVLCVYLPSLVDALKHM